MPSRLAVCARSRRPIRARTAVGPRRRRGGAAWALTRGAGVVVAVVDTGVAPAPDLAGRLLPGWNVIAGSDDAADDNGHGTHVAGTVAEVEGNGLAESGRGAGGLDPPGQGALRRRQPGATSMSPPASSGRPITLPASSTSASAAARPRRCWPTRSPTRAARACWSSPRPATTAARSACPPVSPECSPSGPSMPRSCGRRSAPAAVRSTSSHRASASCSRRSTGRVAMPTARSRARRWRRRTSRASRRWRSRPGRATTATRRRAPAHPDGARPRARRARTSAYGAGLVRADAALGVAADLPVP